MFYHHTVVQLKLVLFKNQYSSVVSVWKRFYTHIVLNQPQDSDRAAHNDHVDYATVIPGLTVTPSAIDQPAVEEDSH